MPRPITTASLAKRIGTSSKQVSVWHNANWDELQPVGKRPSGNGGRHTLTWHWAPWREFLIRTGRWDPESETRILKHRPRQR